VPNARWGGQHTTPGTRRTAARHPPRPVPVRVMWLVSVSEVAMALGCYIALPEGYGCGLSGQVPVKSLAS
jgi:hypothetical protein